MASGGPPRLKLLPGSSGVLYAGDTARTPATWSIESRADSGSSAPGNLWIAPGISGAAVLDTECKLVVGLVARRWNPGDKSANDNIPWAVDARVLTFDPFKLPLQEDDLPLNPAPQPRADITASAIQPRASRSRGVLESWPRGH